MHCEFGDYLNQALKDRLVCSIRSENIQKYLLIKAGLTLTQAVELAQGIEAAHQNNPFMKGKTEGPISKVTHEQRSANTGDKSEQHKRKKCYCCGKQGHAAAECQFKNFKCHKCGKIGHIAKVCRTKGVNLTECIETDPSDDVIFKVDNRTSPPYQVLLKVNN